MMTMNRFRSVAFVGILAFSAPSVADECSPAWEADIGNPGPGSCVYALEIFDDGTGPAIYAAGIFSALDRVAKWDGTQWLPLGEGVNPDSNDLAVFDDGNGPALYITGSFVTAGGQPANHIARWDGENWSPLGDGLNGQGLGLTVFDDGNGPALYVTGVFTEAGGQTVNHIARWDGENWSALGTGVNNAATKSAVFDDGTGPALYVGGTFTTAGGVSVAQLARWDGENWSDVSNGTGGTVLGVDTVDLGEGDALYVSGIFSSVGGGVSANNIAKWDGESWSALGSGTNGLVRKVTAHDDGTGNGKALYAAGNYSQAGSVAANNIAKWDGQEWSRLSNGLEGGTNQSWAVLSVGTDIDDAPGLYVGGCFSFAGGLNANHVAVWRGCADASPGPQGDLNGDGVVDVADLLILLSQWGPCPRDAGCTADLNDDGTVDVADMLILLANWG